MVVSDLCEIWVNSTVIGSSERSRVQVDDHESICTVQVFSTGRSQEVQKDGHVSNPVKKGNPQKKTVQLVKTAENWMVFCSYPGLS